MRVMKIGKNEEIPWGEPFQVLRSEKKLQLMHEGHLMERPKRI